MAVRLTGQHEMNGWVSSGPGPANRPETGGGNFHQENRLSASRLGIFQKTGEGEGRKRSSRSPSGTAGQGVSVPGLHFLGSRSRPFLKPPDRRALAVPPRSGRLQKCLKTHRRWVAQCPFVVRPLSVRGPALMQKHIRDELPASISKLHQPISTPATTTVGCRKP